MTKTIIDILKTMSENIMKAVPAFTGYYHNCRLTDEDGVVSGFPEFKPVTCEDSLGEYFYLRVGSVINVERGFHPSDCDKAIVEKYPIFLVAQGFGFEPYGLKDALTNQILKMGFPVKTQNVDPYYILRQELSGLDINLFKSAISKVRNKTFVRIEFSADRPFVTNNCEIDVCKKC